MYKKSKNRNGLAVLLAAVFIFTFLAGFFQVSEGAGSFYGTLMESLAVSSAEIDINRASTGMEQDDPGAESDSRRPVEDLLFLSGIVSSSGSSFLVIVIWAFFFAVAGFSDSKRTFRAEPSGGESRLCYYRSWFLEFLSPFQKIIRNLSERFDIDPVYGYRGFLKPAFKSSDNAGFFIAYQGGPSL